jgi:hypothetical protein
VINSYEKYYVDRLIKDKMIRLVEYLQLWYLIITINKVSLGDRD